MMQNNWLVAIQAALAGGEEIIKVYNDEFEVELKEDNSPLTIADQNANDVINQYLIKTGIPIISEENKQLDYSERKVWKSCWIVDPLDGTKEFVKRNGEFTVNIAFIKNNKPEFGVIYVPVSGELYFGDVSEKWAKKALISNHQFDLNRINEARFINPAKENTAKLRVVGSRSHMNDATRNYVKEQEEKGVETEIVSKGSSLKFCLVAEGLADVYPRFAPTMEWDTAAGQAICESVGLKVINQDTNLPLEYNRKDLLNPWFLVSK